LAGEDSNGAAGGREETVDDAEGLEAGEGKAKAEEDGFEEPG